MKIIFWAMNIFWAIPFILGLYVAYEGIDVLTTKVRGEGLAIYKLGMMIPIKDTPIYLYGSTFLLVGAILVLSPIIIKMVLASEAKVQ